MGTQAVRERLSSLPGVLTCTVAAGSVTLEALPDADLRLLRARAEAVCGAEGDARSVVVVPGVLPPPVPAGAAAAALRRAGRPGVVATASGLVLAFLAVAPDGPPTPVTPAARAELAIAPAAPAAGAPAARGDASAGAARTGRRATTTGVVAPDGRAAEAALSTSQVTAALALAPPSTSPSRPAGGRAAAPDRRQVATARPSPAPAPPAPTATAPPAPTTPAPAAPVVTTPAAPTAPTTAAPAPEDDWPGRSAGPPANARRDAPAPPASAAAAVPGAGGSGRGAGRRP